jgi:tetratricopeptide (TPR) repeat protein
MTSINIEALESLIRTQSAGREADAKLVLMRLGHEIKTRMARKSELSVDFVEASVRSLTRLKGSGNAALRMECLCDSGEYLFSNRRISAALVAGAACESLARQVGDLEFASKSQVLQSMANAELGNAADAVVQCSHALDIALRIGNVRRQLSALINLGIALHYAGVDREAISCYDRVLELVGDRREAIDTDRKGYPAEDFEFAALTNKAQSYYALGDFPQSFKSIKSCLDRSPEPITAMECERRTIREFTFVQVALELGKLSAAREHTQLCYQYGRRAHDRARFPSEIAGALCELHGGDSQRGIGA